MNKPSRKLTELQLKRIGKRTEFAKPFDKVTLQDVNSYKQKRLSEVSTTTTRDDLMLIRRIYRWYINEWLVKAGQELVNPCNRLALPKARKVRDTLITRKQLGLLLREMTPLMAQVVELAFETAMRRSEILKLRECDLHLEDRFLRVVEGKEGSRDVPLTRRAVRLLEYAVARSADQVAGCTQWLLTVSLRRSEGRGKSWGCRIMLGSTNCVTLALRRLRGWD